MKGSTITHLKPQNPKTDARTKDRCSIIRRTAETARFIKTGEGPGIGEYIDATPFANQKAKVVRMSEYSFPVFVIRKPKQRSSYGEKGGGDETSPYAWKPITINNLY